jgi:chemotaxis protein MotB
MLRTDIAGRAPALMLAVALAAAAVAAAAGCGIPSSEHDKVLSALDAEKAKRADEHDKRKAAEKERDELKKRIADLEAEVAERDAKLADMDAAMKTMSTSLGMTEAELEKLKSKADELEKKSAEFEALNAALKDEIDSGKIELLGDKVRLKEGILFKSGSSKLNKEGMKALKTIAGVFKKFGARKIFQITGHTDNVGGADYNWELSTERALTVVKYLTKMGVTPSLMSAAGFGEYRPICPKNDTPECRASNRRIDIVLLPNIDISKKPADAPAPAPAPSK